MSLLGCHDSDTRLRRYDRGNSLIGCLVYFHEHTVIKPRGTGFGADPQRAFMIGLQCEYSAAGQCGIVDRLRATAVKLCESRFGAKPHRAVAGLSDSANAIGRKSVKQRDRAPLVQSCDWCWGR